MKNLIIVLTVVLTVACQSTFESGDGNVAGTYVYGDSKTEAIAGTMSLTGGVIGKFHFDYGVGGLREENVISIALAETNDKHWAYLRVYAVYDSAMTITRCNTDLSLSDDTNVRYWYGTNKLKLTITIIDSSFISGTLTGTMEGKFMRLQKNDVTYFSEKNAGPAEIECTFKAKRPIE